MTSATIPDRSRAAFRAVHCFIALVVLASLIIQVTLLVHGGADANSGESGESVDLITRFVRLFSFFTIQSNIIVGVVSGAFALGYGLRSTLGRVAHLDALLGIVITGLVFDLVLAGQVDLHGWAYVATIGLHYISPWASLLAWLLLGPRHRFSLRIVGWAFVWPIAWLVYTFVRGAAVHWYPYPFLDVDAKGFGTALFNASMVVVLGVVLFALFLLIDRRVPAIGDSVEETR